MLLLLIEVGNFAMSHSRRTDVERMTQVYRMPLLDPVIRMAVSKGVLLYMGIDTSMLKVIQEMNVLEM